MVEGEPGQEVISPGLYAIVRHRVFLENGAYQTSVLSARGRAYHTFIPPSPHIPFTGIGFFGRLTAGPDPDLQNSTAQAIGRGRSEQT